MSIQENDTVMAVEHLHCLAMNVLNSTRGRSYELQVSSLRRVDSRGWRRNIRREKVTVVAASGRQEFCGLDKNLIVPSRYGAVPQPLRQLPCTSECPWNSQIVTLNRGQEDMLTPLFASRELANINND